MPAPNELVIELRDIFVEKFSMEELNDLIFELGMHPDDISGSTRRSKARELASHLSRHDRIAELATIGPNIRPDVDWVGLLEPYGLAPVNPLIVTTTVVDFRVLQDLVPIVAARPMFINPEGRQTVLSLAGVREVVSADLNGNAQVVAASVLDQLNRYGEISPGESALGRLLDYVRQDPALPPDQKRLLDDVIQQHALMTGS